MSIHKLQTLFCSGCGNALQNFWSPENNTWFVGHSQYKEQRDNSTCRFGKQLFIAEEIKLEEVK